MRTIFRAVAYKRAANINNTIVGFKTPADANRTSAINLARAFPESPNVCSASGDASNPGGCNILPSHEQTEQLVNRYFSNTGMLFPYIHKPSFVETYSHIREQNFRGNVRRTFLGLLNMVLAMAAWSESGRQSTTRTTSHFESAIFYQRAQELCGKPMQRGTSLETGKERDLSNFDQFIPNIVHASAISPLDEPVPPGNSTVRPNLGRTRFGSQSSHVNRDPFQRSIAQIARR
jgi:hypothetical protein